MPWIVTKCPACLQPLPKCACSRWCAECECLTNHSTEQHRAAQADQEEE